MKTIHYAASQPLQPSHPRAALKAGIAAALPKTFRSTMLWSSLLLATSVPAFAVEPWIMVDRTFFAGDTADQARGQGVATDGNNWFFSGTNSLEIAAADYTSLLRNSDAIATQLKIPSEFSDIGLNHIGDIDYANGLLYISLDSSNKDPVTGNKYSNPVFAVYDATTLEYTGVAYALNPPDGVHDIASWVAVDAKAGLAYGMAYDNATQIAVYNLSDMSFVKYIPLAGTIDQAQGGKILDGWMYFSTDNDSKLLMRANLTTGEVETLGNLYLNGASQEVEGLAIKQTADGWSMNVLNREESYAGSGEGGVAIYEYLRPWGNALSGEIHADINGALVEDSHFVRDAANRRLLSAFEAPGASTAATIAYDKDGLHAAPANADGIVFWSEALAMTGMAQASGDAADFNRSSAGFVAGVDAPVGDWRLGVMGGYSHSSFKVDDRSSSASSDNYDVGVYGGTQWGNLGLRAGAAYGWHDISTNRSVVFPIFQDYLSADYNAATTQAFGELGYRIDLGKSRIEPFANLAYVHLGTDGFSETGGDTAALSAGDTTTENTFTTFGMRGSTQFVSSGMTSTLHGMVGWQHAYEDVAPSTTLTFNTDASFDSVGVPIAKDALALEAGFDLAASARATLGAAYSGQIGSDSQNHAVKVNFDLKF